MFINISRLQLFILLMGNWFKDPNTSLFSRFGSQHGPFCSRICTAFFKMNSFGLALFLTGQTKSLRLYVVFASPSHWRFLRWVRCSFSKIKILRLDRHFSTVVIIYTKANVYLTKRDRCWLRKKSSQGRLHHFLLFSWNDMRLRHSNEWVTLYLYTLKCRSQISHQSSAQIFVDRELFTKDALKIFVDSNVGHVQTIMSKLLLS